MTANAPSSLATVTLSPCQCLGEAVDADDGRPALAEGLGLVGEIAEAGGNYDKARREKGVELIEMGNLFFVIIVRVAEDEAVAAGESDVLCATYDSREEGGW